MPDRTDSGRARRTQVDLSPRARRALEEVVGPSHLLTDPDVTAGYSVDWTGRFRGRTPAVVRPGSPAEVAGVVAVARAEGLALVPQGGNTGLVGGSVPLEGEVVLSLTRLADTGPVDVDRGQVTTGAGVTLASLAATAAASGWEYGVDLAARGVATVGGTIATNTGGLHVLRHGSTRAQLLGVEAVMGDGRVLDDLRRLDKDATGYDLSGLLCGSEGTLGVIVAARLRLVPHDPDRALAAVGFASMHAAVEAVGQLRRGLPGLNAAEVYRRQEAELVARYLDVGPALRTDPAVTVLVEVAGHGDQIPALAAAVDSLAGVEDAVVATDGPRQAALWRHRESLSEAIAARGRHHKLDVSLHANRLADFVHEVVPRIAAVAPAASTWLFGHLGDGNLHVNVSGVDPDDPAVDDAVLGLVLEMGGSVSAEHGVGTAKRAWVARQRGDAAMEAMRAIKSALDPDGILNPNVLLSPP